MTQQRPHTPRSAPTLLRIFSLAVLSLAISACGGGGGGDGGGNPVVVVPPMPMVAPETVALKLTDENARDSVTIAAGLVESTLQIAGAARKIIESVERQGELQFTEACVNTGGALDIDFSDVDMDLKPSPGDSIRATFRDCLLVELGDAASGGLTIAFVTPDGQASATETFYKGALDLQQLTVELGADSLSVNGEPEFEFMNGQLGQSERVTGDIRYGLNTSVGSSSENAFNLDLQKSLSFVTARYEITSAGYVESQALGGRVDIAGASQLSGYLGTFPEQGQFEITGSEGSRVFLQTGLTQAEARANIQLDADGSGSVVDLPNPQFWSEVLEGYLWWYPAGSPDGFENREFVENEFFVVYQTPEDQSTIGVSQTFRVQFSRPFDPSSIPDMLQINQASFTAETINLDLNVESQGALLLLAPVEQLPFNGQFFVPSSGFDVTGPDGATARVTGQNFNTADSLRVRPTALSKFGLPGDSVDLDGTASVAVDGAIQTYSWTQVSGTAATINNADADVATVVLPVVSASEVLEFELQITNENSETNAALVEVAVFPNAAAVRLVYMEGGERDPIGRNRTWLLTDGNGTFEFGPNFTNDLRVITNFALAGDGRFFLEFVAPRDAPLEVGLYADITESTSPFLDVPSMRVNADGISCSLELGSFEVSEIEYGADGSIDTIALNFEHRCADSDALVGYIRIGTSLPF